MKAEQLPTRPGIQADMQQQPQSDLASHIGTGKLQNKVAIVTGGDSGIGRAVAVAYAKEGCKVVINYLNEHTDAKKTEQLVKNKGGTCILVPGDVGDSAFCTKLIAKTIDTFGGLDILANIAGEQHPQDGITAISDEQLEQTFRTNNTSAR